MTEFKITSTGNGKGAICAWTGKEIDLIKILIEIMHADERIRAIFYCALTTHMIEAKIDIDEIMDLTKKVWATYRPSN